MIPSGPSHGDSIDDRLLRRHTEGDREAFGEIVERHRDRLWAVAVDVCGDRGVAADAVHDGILTAFRAAVSHHMDTTVGRWLLRVVVHACSDDTRVSRPGVEPLTATPGPQVDPRAALRQLPEEQRLVLVLGDLHGVPVSETAEILGVSVDTVTRRWALGREGLAAMLAEGRVGTSGTPEQSTTSDTADHHGTKGGGHDR